MCLHMSVCPLVEVFWRSQEVPWVMGTELWFAARAVLTANC